MTTAAPTKCSSCGNVPFGGKLRKCGSCHTTAYCNGDCQKEHWKIHKAQCKKMKAAKIRDITTDKADEIKQDDVGIIVNNERLVVSRVREKDGTCFTQFMPKEPYGAFINATKPPCWCGDVGEGQSLLVAMPIDLDQLKTGTTDEVHLAKGKNVGGVIQSQYLSAFGVNFQIGLSEMMGNLSVSLSEEANEGYALESHVGVNTRTTYFFLSGADATSLNLPPPNKGKFKRAGELICNSHMHVWTKVGDSVSMGLHEMKALPRVKGEALRGKSFVFPEGGTSLFDEGVVLVMLIEKVGDVNTKEEFETASIQAQLHQYHADARKEDEIPPFCKDCCRKGLMDLNMKQPVNLVGSLPSATKETATPAATPSAGFKAPSGMEDLSPEGLATLQNIMVGFQSGQPNMGQIEMALGDPEVGPVLQNILAQPNVAPMMAQMMSKMSA